MFIAVRGLPRYRTTPKVERVSERRVRVRAPELRGRGWLNTGGRPLSLAELRGRIVLLDFWTFCCINCLHVADELRPLEEKYADVLVTIGVHSPKFEHEADPAALAAAVERYEIGHPVLDDPELETWQQYAVRAWPTLVVVDPEGYVVAHAAGEGHAEGIGRLIDELVAEHGAKGTLRYGDSPLSFRGTPAPEYTPPPAETALRYPGKVLVTPLGTLLVSDSRHHSLVELASDGETVLRRIGSGRRGTADGDAGSAEFAEPQGVLLLPAPVATELGYEVVVADTVNHALRGVRLRDGAVHTVARAPEGVPLSPWDLAWWQGRVVVAAAGTHQLWEFDPVLGTFEAFAGTTAEALRDGPVAEAAFAQPSGLAADGDRLWVADAETSSLRRIEAGQAHTAVGQGLFEFGHVDGPAADALFQHPLGVTVLPDGSVAVCDTYNNAVRRYDPATDEVSTLATDVAEPSAAVVLDGSLVVVESAAHRLTRPVAPGVWRRIEGERRQTHRPVAEIGPGEVTLDVVYTAPPGQKLDERYGPATRLQVGASPPALLREGAGDGTDLRRRLVLNADAGTGVLHVSAQAASCDVGVEHPACHLTRQDWGVPVRVVPGGPTRLALVLRGMDDGDG
jgi:thiol-disulfide isomerase/thioredoxin